MYQLRKRKTTAALCGSLSARSAGQRQSLFLSSYPGVGKQPGDHMWPVKDVYPTHLTGKNNIHVH